MGTLLNALVGALIFRTSVLTYSVIRDFYTCKVALVKKKDADEEFQLLVVARLTSQKNGGDTPCHFCFKEGTNYSLVGARPQPESKKIPPEKARQTKTNQNTHKTGGKAKDKRQKLR